MFKKCGLYRTRTCMNLSVGKPCTSVCPMSYLSNMCVCQFRQQALQVFLGLFFKNVVRTGIEPVIGAYVLLSHQGRFHQMSKEDAISIHIPIRIGLVHTRVCHFRHLTTLLVFPSCQTVHPILSDFSVEFVPQRSTYQTSVSEQYRTAFVVRTGIEPVIL